GDPIFVVKLDRHADRWSQQQSLRRLLNQQDIVLRQTVLLPHSGRQRNGSSATDEYLFHREPELRIFRFSVKPGALSSRRTHRVSTKALNRRKQREQRTFSVASTLRFLCALL